VVSQCCKDGVELFPTCQDQGHRHGKTRILEMSSMPFHVNSYFQAKKR
ncbi:hypothetical protein PanWU01x14_155320, partial [Parasponia andersonii]